MKVSTETDGPCRRILHIEIPAEAVKAETETVTGQFMREARIPGFRPGRAPRAMVERRFAQAISEQVQERLLPKFYQQAIAQEKIEPVNVLDVTHGAPDPQAGMTIKVVVDLPPDLQLPNYRPITLTDETAAVTDAKIEDALLNLRRHSARYLEVDRPAREQDLVFFDYDRADAAAPEDASGSRELVSGRDIGMLMNREREILPGFYDGLLGVRPNEERRLTAGFPENHPVAAVAGKSIDYQVRVKNIREEVLPELDQAFLASLQVSDAAELRQRLQERLKVAAQEGEHRRRMDAITRFLLDNTPIENLPQSLIAEENRTVLQNLVRDFTAQGVPRETIAENRDEIMQMAERTSVERVKLNAILDKIANQENLTVSDEAFKAYVEGLATRTGIPAAKAWKTIAQRDAGKSIMEQMRRARTVNFLLEQAQVAPGGGELPHPTHKDTEP